MPTTQRDSDKILQKISATAYYLIGFGGAILFFLLGHKYPSLNGFLWSLSAALIGFFVNSAVSAMRKRLLNRKLGRFIGPDLFENRFLLVYPDFILEPTIYKLAEREGLHGQRLFTKRDPKFSNTYRIDIPNVVAINDLEALLNVSVFLNATANYKPDLMSDDEAITKSDFSFMSFGFSSNECTHMYLDACNDAALEIKTGGSDPRYDEHVVVISEASNHVFESSGTKEIGILIKYSPGITNRQGHSWWYCSGLGPTATKGTSYYFTSHWKYLDAMTKGADFIAIVEVASYSHVNTRLRLLICDGKVIFDE